MSPSIPGSDPLSAILAILFALFAAGVVITLLVLGFGLIFKLIGRVFACVFGIIGDAFAAAANILVAPIHLARALVLLVFARFRSADAAATRFHQNLIEVARRIWSAGVQRPLRIVGVQVPPVRRRALAPAPPPPPGVAVAAAGGAAAAALPPPPGPASQPPPWPESAAFISGFPGYSIEGRLPSGGSGAKLYIASPDSAKRKSLRDSPARVVIKSFAIGEGSTLPQIVRESRSLDAARSLGLVLDHAFEPHRFWYAMPHFEGPALGHYATVRHRGVDASAPLPDQAQRELVGLVADVVESLARFHRAGLWHKDIKPDNIIVSAGRAQLIDVGLVTPLASSFTLTTHGTEYFRDPEMVRQALRGTKVNEVDGARFDLYSAGAVLYAVLENTFPAHGGLSGFSKPSPEALRWIVRRSMADYSKRYPTAEAMLADLRFLLAAKDIHAVRPAALPSMQASGGSAPPPGVAPAMAAAAAAGMAGGVRQPTLAELARMTAIEAMAAARAASAEAVAAARAAASRHSARSASRARKSQAKESAPSTPRQAWSPWATTAVVVVAILVFGTRFERTSNGSVRVSGPGFRIGPNDRNKNRNSAQKPAPSPADPLSIDLPSGDGKLLVDRAAILAGPIPESLEAQAIAQLGARGWSPVIGDVDALAAIESLRGSAPETIQAELARRGYSGLVRLETKGERLIVMPISLPSR